MFGIKKGTTIEVAMGVEKGSQGIVIEILSNGVKVRTFSGRIIENVPNGQYKRI